MSFPRIFSALILLTAFFHAQIGRTQISKGHLILINRGFQVQGMVTKDDVFSLTTYSNANYTSINWLWESNPSLMGTAPGFPWSRWAGDETQVPPTGSEGPYMNQLVTLQLGDEWHLNDDAIRDRAVNWFNAIRNNFPETILYMNSYGGQVGDAQLFDFYSRAQPDMLSFDSYPWKSAYGPTPPYAPLGGQPTSWYGDLRRYREHAKGANIPYACYMQTFHAVQDYDSTVYRDPSPSELRLNHFAALAFNAKVLIDFTYNTGASSLFTTPGGDSNPTPLYAVKADCNLRARNFGKALVRLKPIDDAVPQSYTTGMMFIRGRDSAGTPNPLPIGFLADPQTPNENSDWVLQRNDPYLNGWSVTNKGTVNNGHSGDVIVSWFKPLDESLDGPDYSNEIYMMVVNGLADIGGTAADCLQEIKFNFASTLLAVEMLNPLTGSVEVHPLTLTNGSRQLVLNLNGGDAALFKFANGAPFLGAQVVGPPVIVEQPESRTNLIGGDATFSVTAAGASPFSYQWKLNGANISGATTNSYTRTNVQPSDDLKDFTVVASNASGSVTSAPATLTVVASLPAFFYEPFAYSNIGEPVSSNTPANWTFGGNLPNDLNVTGGNLSYPGLISSTGNSVTNGGAGLGVRRLFGTNVSDGVVYFSALFRINNLGYGTGGWNGVSSQVGALTSPDNGSFRLGVMVKTNSASSYVFGLTKGGSGSTTVFDTTEHHANETIFLVGKYDFTTSPNTATLWINPDSSTFGSNTPPANFIANTNGTNGLAIDRFNIRQNTAASVPAAMQWDELRVGKSWAEVTPPEIAFTNSVQLGDGRFQFGYSNSFGRSGNIYASSNLLDWISLGAAMQIAPGLYQFTDPDATNYTRRFYQLRSP